MSSELRHLSVSNPEKIQEFWTSVLAFSTQSSLGILTPDDDEQLHLKVLQTVSGLVSDSVDLLTAGDYHSFISHLIPLLRGLAQVLPHLQDDKTKDVVSRALELWYHKKLPEREEIGLPAFTYLLEKTSIPKNATVSFLLTLIMFLRPILQPFWPSRPKTNVTLLF